MLNIPNAQHQQGQQGIDGGGFAVKGTQDTYLQLGRWTPNRLIGPDDLRR